MSVLIVASGLSDAAGLLSPIMLVVSGICLIGAAIFGIIARRQKRKDK